MRIILANRYFHPDQSATSRMVSSLAFSLASDGVEVHVITGRQYHNRNDERLPANETIDGVHVHRLWTTGFGRGKLAGRSIDYATFHLSAAVWWAKHARKDDICVICTDPPLLAITSALPIRLRGAKLGNWVMDLFPETAIELGLLRPNAISTKIALALRDWSMRHAALTICPIDGMARYLAQKGFDRNRLSVVHHWSDKNEIQPIAPASNALRRKWGMSHRFVIGYSGNFGRAHDFTTMLDAASKLDGMKSIAFLLVGEGQQKAYVEAEIIKRGLNNVFMQPFQPVERLSESLGAANVHLVSLKPELEHCIVPSKFYGILAAGRPTIFIGDPDGEIGTTIRTFECGIAVRPGDVDGLVKAILRLKRSLVHRTAMGNNARYLMETAYSREYGTAMWQSTVGQLETSKERHMMPSYDRKLKPGELSR